jgi:hypothetical protein
MYLRGQRGTDPKASDADRYDGPCRDRGDTFPHPIIPPPSWWLRLCPFALVYAKLLRPV